jgi:Protein of unknown function (DUF3617)
MPPRISTALLAAIGLTLAVAPLFAADRMQTGQWEFTSTTKGETHTFKHCVTSDEVGSVNGDTRSARANAAKRAAGHCIITYYKVDGNVVSYAMVCGPTAIRNTATYHGDTFEADLTTNAEGAAEVVAHVKARRLGACP